MSKTEAVLPRAGAYNTLPDTVASKLQTVYSRTDDIFLPPPPHTSIYPKGGMLFAPEAIERHRKVSWEFVKKIGSSILQGKNLMHISLPVGLFEPRSYLERMTDIWCYAPVFLTAAALASNDPLERFKYVVAFVISGLHHTCHAGKPFNPILGETFEATYADGTTICCEQTSHHPAVSHFQINGPNGLYVMTGHGQPTASFRGNSVKGNQKGVNSIRFSDGTVITHTLPNVWMQGVLWGDRLFEYLGKMKVDDDTNNLHLELEFNPDGGFFKTLFSSAKHPTDWFRGQITQNVCKPGSKPKPHNLMLVEGSWLTHLDIGNVRYWEVDRFRGFRPQPVANPLPSDSRFRADLQFLSVDDFERAQEHKVVLEERQRYEENLRKENLKKK
eukprot:gnl/Hemi2/21834_TR7289_c0_g1_i1.p1 gnl/Hemi2/21834_TR7289_c0_g1~~gnl/Hemi2/21834_TR7289_c0_g1_i1.p1  ORF type:complete len:435 (+),score=130.94 gnl/Hemi2/21834_TR7289_c0_g1_i1:145-1305(+)